MTSKKFTGTFLNFYMNCWNLEWGWGLFLLHAHKQDYVHKYIYRQTTNLVLLVSFPIYNVRVCCNKFGHLFHCLNLQGRWNYKLINYIASQIFRRVLKYKHSFSLLFLRFYLRSPCFCPCSLLVFQDDWLFNLFMPHRKGVFFLCLLHFYHLLHCALKWGMLWICLSISHHILHP